MVLVSKLRGSSSSSGLQQSGSSSSFFSKIRTTLTRSSSSTAIQVMSPQAVDVRNLPCMDKFDDSAPCDSAAGKITSVRESFGSRNVDNIVELADFEPDRCSVPEPNCQNLVESRVTVATSCIQPGLALSICGDPCNREDTVISSEMAEVAAASELKMKSPVHNISTPTERCRAGEAAVLSVESKPLAASAQKEVPGRLWSGEPPAQVHQAWDMKREKESAALPEKRVRIPARLPPLSGLTSKSLRRLTGAGSTAVPVTEVTIVRPAPTSPRAPGSPRRGSSM